MTVKRALIIGVTGQDGAYLAANLLGRNYEVVGSSRSNHPELAGLTYLGIAEQVKMVQLDPNCREQIERLLRSFKADEVYNLSGQSSVGRSFEAPELTFDSIASAQHVLLDVVSQYSHECKVLNAGSGECFGSIKIGEKSRVDDPYQPLSPYAAAKVASADITSYYRKVSGLFACTAFLFSHESPLRKEQFVTRKIVDYVVDISVNPNKSQKLELGNLDIVRDWGFAGDYVEAMIGMLQNPTPDDVIVATGRSHSLEEFIQQAFSTTGLNWQDHTVSSNALLRKSDIHYSCGDPEQASNLLGWRAKTAFPQLVEMLVNARREFAQIQSS